MIAGAHERANTWADAFSNQTTNLRAALFRYVQRRAPLKRRSNLMPA